MQYSTMMFSSFKSRFITKRGCIRIFAGYVRTAKRYASTILKVIIEPQTFICVFIEILVLFNT